ncbi:phenylacetate--CoA ligase [Methanoregula sp.]|uniref:phenylacetate--CoA ligase family protein n=1 Tax=Methanoregula sp. TaxID=2052170 RepID=UPI00236C3D00|nr:phenylacetate--CoA ligase [Methanoregula sp.]MDD1685361.1 phenylacetate--CoA ligase [Methanoregula sp.]
MTDKKYWDKTIETMPRKDLEKYQLKLLNNEIAFARKGSPYYKKILPAKKLSSVDDIRNLPFLTKQTIRERQQASEPFGDLVAVPENEIVYISASSGSTGVPTASPFTAQDFEDFIDCQARLFWRSGMRNTDRYIHALNFSLFIGGPCVLGAQKLGALSIHAGSIPSERLLNFVKQFQPGWTWTTPSFAWYLGETAKKLGIDPAKDLSIRNIICSGEPGGAIKETRENIEDLWNANLYEYYGLSDIFGACAGSCTEKSGIHIEEDHMIVEVLDPKTGEPVGEGERGEMVLTTLKKRARPLIRFRTGDIVTYTDEKCDCGRTHKRLHGIHGRTDDMLIVKGVNVFPSDVEAVVRGADYLTGEYRLIVDRAKHLDVLTIEVENTKKKPAEVQAQLATAIKARLGVTAQVIVHPPGTLPRETHKAKRIIDKRANVWE